MKERNHKCDACGKEFFQEASLRAHVDAVHLLKKDVWERSFAQKSGLEGHVDTVHLGLARHECEVCWKKFRHRDNST